MRRELTLSFRRRDRGRGRTAGGAGFVAAALVALVLGPALAVAPPMARVAAAADSLQVEAAATYVVDPSAHLVHVSVAMAATNLTPDEPRPGGTLIHWYRDLRFPIHAEAASLAASDERGGLRVDRQAGNGFDVVTVRLRANLYYRQTATFTLRYDLAAGAPRSTSGIRVGQAFVGFYVYAWGSPGLGSVRVELPAAYRTAVSGDPLERSLAGSTLVLSAASIADPDAWFAVVSADRDSRLTTSRLALGGGDTIVIRAWPEDSEWQSRVDATLRLGMPKLRQLVGLDWPVDGELIVTEVQAAALEGYAGIYDTFTDTIRISENLDELTILHEASHAWFNGDLFDARWISEGLADQYASLVVDGLGTGTYEAPTRPAADDPGRVALNDWVFPGRIDDEATAARETYGYDASWYVVRTIEREIGPDAMRAVLRAADGNAIAYVGAAKTESVSSRDDWRRFLDLVDELGGSRLADDLFGEYVVASGDEAGLADRAEARTAYGRLVADGGDWRPPYVVRRAMSDWRFADAERWIGEAEAILDERTSLEADAAGLGVSLPDELAAAWDAAAADFGAVREAADALDNALADLAAARAALDAPRDLFASVGLLGTQPDEAWATATAALEAGDLAAADTATDEATAILAEAPDAGRLRVAVAAGGLGGGLALGVLLVRRARRRPVRAAAAGPNGAESAAGLSVPADVGPEAVGPYATLPAAAPREEPGDAPGPAAAGRHTES